MNDRATIDGLRGRLALRCQARKQLEAMALAPFPKSDVESESGMNYIYCFRYFDTFQ
jgi:hypothetical protein